jgi:adenine-specific DNA-methyltransferase
MAENVRWGLDNPHPLSRMKTELVWEGKYDEYGNRRTVDIAGCAMPLQKIETIDEPASRAHVQGSLFDPLKAHHDDFRNMLISGDNKLVMASLLKDFKGKIDLIYIDPPFDVGADFTMNVPIGDEKETVGKDRSALEMVAYRDIWGKGADSYLQMIFERLVLMKELLSEKGCILVHLDETVSSYVKVILDEMFGRDFYINSIPEGRATGCDAVPVFAQQGRCIARSGLYSFAWPTGRSGSRVDFAASSGSRPRGSEAAAGIFQA